MKLLIETMTCGGCTRGVTATIQEVDPDATVNVDLSTKLVTIETTASVDQMITALLDNGFAAKVQ